MRVIRAAIVAMTMLFATAATAASAETVAETAAAFGAREGVEQVSLSPDGSQIAFLAPTRGQGSTLFTVSTAEGAVPKPALSVSGAPDRLRSCRWVSEKRLVCTVWGMLKAPEWTLPLGYSRIFAVDAGGGNQKMLSNQQMNRQRTAAFGGEVIDWLPKDDGKVLMLRDYQRTDTLGTNIGSTKEGIGVDRIDTLTGRHEAVESPRQHLAEFITDGEGNVRIAGYWEVKGETFQMTGNIAYRYRPAGSRGWETLGTLNTVSHDGFNPYAVDARRNIAYGLNKREGRQALFSRTLDGSNVETLVFARPDVDVSGVARIGREQRVVGATYVTDRRMVEYFDPQVKALVASLHKALPALPQINVTDASNDEQRLLIHAASDTDPGRYFLFDRTAKKLQVLMLDRPQMAGRTLATVRPVQYRAADGTMIPAYLTLPPEGPQKGLPAIVMPHGGPSARDEWGFDWLAQFFAARGYAVIQPNFRGSAGYGEAFLMENGFRAWRTAIGDVDDAGRWLVSQGIADRDRMAIVGWSYGGYAALQSGVVEPGLFKAIVAIAPVTDLGLLKDDLLDWSNYRVTSDYIGSLGGAASPAQNAGKIVAPVLLVHGTLDANVAYRQSTVMEGRLRSAGKRVELMTFQGLDHGLEDGAARAKVLERADGFIRAAIGG